MFKKFVELPSISRDEILKGFIYFEQKDHEPESTMEENYHILKIDADNWELVVMNSAWISPRLTFLEDRLMSWLAGEGFFSTDEIIELKGGTDAKETADSI